MLIRLAVKVSGPALPSPGINIWHARVGDTDPTFPADYNGIIGWLSTFYSAIKGIYPSGNTISYDGEVVEIATPTPRNLPPGTAFSHAATGAAGGLPAANCVMVAWKTSLATRRGRGRTFLGPIVTSMAAANGTLEEGNRSAVQNAVNQLVASSAAAQAGGKALGVWSPSDAVLRDFTSGLVTDRFGVLRSRRD